MRNQIYSQISVFLLLLIFPLLIHAQQSDNKTNPNRPKIGLVLSGGGAKGIAHIGILKALEEEGIRPDYITGTSMGSIVGGLYALGYSADQLDTIIRQIDWGEVLSNNISLEYIAYEEKEYYNRYLIELPFSKGKINLPSGVIQGQMLGEMLARYTWPAKDYKSFDDFPIPFRCVATDVGTGKPIVFKDGSLAMALRASMAIPTAFTAVDLDSTLAVDGGVVNNFPVEEVINMGADIVIGVSVGDGLIPAKELNGMTDILMQVSMIPSLTRLYDQVELCDIYIRPELKNNGTASFGNYAEILELGHEAGEQYRPEFRKLANKLGIDSNLVFESPSLYPGSIRIAEIQITGNRLVNNALILTKLQIKEGDVVTQHQIEIGVRAVYGINHFEKVVYRLNKLPESTDYLLTIKTIEKTPAVFKSSIHYDNIFKVGVVLNLTLQNLLGKSSRTIIAGDISENPKFRIDYLKYIGGHQKTAVNFRYDYLNERIPTYDQGAVEDIDVNHEHNVSFGFITTQSLRNSIYIGATYQLNRQTKKFSTIIPDEIKQGNFNNFKGEFIFTANTLNDRNYPTNGRELAVGVKSYFFSDYKVHYQKGIDTAYIPVTINDITIQFPISESDFNNLIVKPATPGIYGMVQLDFTRYYNINKKFQIVPKLGAGFTLAIDSSAIFQSYRIGGNQRIRYDDTRFLGLNYAELNPENYALGGLFLQHVLFSNIYLQYGANVLVPYEYVSLDNLESISGEKLFKDNTVLGYGAEVTYKSFVGPISFGISRNSRDSYFRYYFAVGFSFNYSD